MGRDAKGPLGQYLRRRSGGSVSHDYDLVLWTLVVSSEVLVEMNTTSFAWRGTHGIRLRAIDCYQPSLTVPPSAPRAGGS